ncbi:GIY-YIG nuclease family protein [Tamlana agarivorans]|uniref:GIY-YIG nuclease family protein n=1 Tax=Pseudotamlana agarivorans TaxID=481183 RepID=A0ACC5U6D8_9FLAO|nr:GIY-YIG nuclease family protein [Tamlana agarivorans]MBU2949823.1 GIY-YIG nuclease family protein [Tamlana agarivorans]
MNFVYILYSISIDKYYVGETLDIQERIKQHNSGFYDSAYTKQTSDWVLYYSISCEDRVLARKIETHIKKMKSKTYIQNLKKYSEITEKLKSKYN